MSSSGSDAEPFLRGCAWPGTAKVPYPRADPADAGRLPTDTWAMARIPVGVRLELAGDAAAVELDYTCATSDLGYRGEGAGTTFAAWRGDTLLDEQPAEVGPGTVRLALQPAGHAATASGGADGADAGAAPGDALPGDGVAVTVHLPEGMRPAVLAVRGIDGTVEPAPPGPRWLCYGDSIAEGWVASGPARAWPAVAARRHGLDVVNLGYAGAARGETVSAEQIAALPADVISLAYGTNCWGRIPHSVDQVRVGLVAFVDILRQGHPETPVVVASPVLRPDAEATPNRLGATLLAIRVAMEEAVAQRVAAGDAALQLVPGGSLVEPGHLPDGIHPDDTGHRLLADAIGGAVASAVGARAR